MTKKQQKKEVRLTIVREALDLKEIINCLPEGMPKDRCLASISKIVSLAKSHAEVLRMAEVVCFCGKNEQQDTHNKNLLYHESSKIYENIKLKT